MREHEKCALTIHCRSDGL